MQIKNSMETTTTIRGRELTVLIDYVLDSTYDPDFGMDTDTSVDDLKVFSSRRNGYVVPSSRLMDEMECFLLSDELSNAIIEDANDKINVEKEAQDDYRTFIADLRHSSGE